MSREPRVDSAGEDGIWQYRARWRSPIGYLTILLLLLGGLMLLPVLGGDFKLVVGALFFFGLAWLLGKPILTGGWIVRIGPRGISSHALNGRTVPWRDVRDLGIETIQGNTMIVLTLAPDATESLQKTRRWLSGRKPERRIPLTGLKPDQVKEVVAAARATFAARAGEHAAAAVQARQEEARMEAAFAHDLERLTPVTWALYAVMALNIGVWLANLVAGMSPMRPTPPELFRWGANSASAVTGEHEYWRLLTGTFLHGGLVHLAMNMIGLWGAGKLLSRLYGNAQFLLVYLASALAGSAASLHFGAQTSVAVGASGAVFGVLGAVLVAVRRHRERVPRNVSRSVMTSEGVFLVYALVNGFTKQGIDNAAHVGGLVAGAALAWVLAANVEPERGRRGQRAALAAAGVALAVAVLVAMTPSPPVDHRSFFATNADFQQAVARLQAAQRGLQKDAEEGKAGRLTEPQMVERLEKVHLPALRAANADLGRIPLGVRDPRAEVTRDMRQLNAKRIEAMELQVRMHRGEAGPDAAAQMQRLQGELQVIATRLKDRAAATAKKP